MGKSGKASLTFEQRPERTGVKIISALIMFVYHIYADYICIYLYITFSVNCVPSTVLRNLHM